MNDDVKAKLAEACKDMSTQEIAQALAASRHGESLEDPLAVAALIKSWG
jgi:hypothetical protein